MKKSSVLRDIGEFGLHRRIQEILGNPSPGVLVGIGDDAAVIQSTSRPLVMTQDAMVEGIHFRTAWTTAADLAYKALAANISDLAAKAAQPLYGLIALGIPGDTPISWLEEFYQTLAHLRHEWGLEIIGGDTVASPRIVVSITAIGSLIPPEPVRIDSARVGDRILVTGTLGDATAGLEILEHPRESSSEEFSPFLIQRFRRPLPRLRESQAIVSTVLPSSMTDISDGLARDLPKLCHASGVGAKVMAENLPRSRELCMYTPESTRYAWKGGEEYELLFTLPPDQVERFHRDWDSSRCRLTVIGEITDLREGIRVDGLDISDPAGFDHFR